MRRNNRGNRLQQRESTHFASVSLPVARLTPLGVYLRMLEDLRAFHPLGDYRRPAGFSRRDQSSLVRKPMARATGALGQLFGDRVRFAVPQRTVICVRRKRRREVLFAKRRTGKGAYSRKRRNVNSEVHC